MVLAPPRTRVPRWVAALRFAGWTLIAAGVVVALYLVYALVFTSRETDAAQSALAEEWQRAAAGAPADVDEAPPSLGDDEQAEDGREAHDGPEADDSSEVAPELGAGTAADDDPTVGNGSAAGGRPDRAVAILEFSRPGSATRPVTAAPLFVVGDVTLEALTQGPGHYPRTAGPGEEGNFAVAGHRTTYGAPFFRLDDLRAGDEVHVTGRDGARHTYRVREQRIVSPGDTWVVNPDPLGTGQRMLTLTTCHPRFSARQRLVVWAELA